MAFFDYSIAGISNTVQFGKQGLMIGSNGTQFSLYLSDGTTIAPVIVATPTVSGHASNKGYVDVLGTAVGISAGSTYSPNVSSHYINSVTSVIGATNNLDSALYTTNTNVGLNAAGVYNQNTAAHFINTAISVVDSTNKLDTAIYNNKTILNTVETSVGLSTLGSYTAPTSNYLGSTTSVLNALTTLDGQIYTINGLNLGTRVTNLETFEATANTNITKLTNATTSVHDTQLTLTTTINLLTFTPATISNYFIQIFYRVVTAATNISINVLYTDNGSNSQTLNIVPSTLQTVGNYYTTAFINVAPSTSVYVNALVGTANQVYVSVTATQS
jgi:hypothetical protein